MSLYESWLQSAYTQDGVAEQNHWAVYLPIEQAVYENLLKEKTTTILGTVSELAVRFHMSNEQVCGFVDGINEALDDQVDVKELEEDTKLKLSFTFENLYKKMVEYKADHLYNLPEWEAVFPADVRKQLYAEQRKSSTIVKDPVPGRNDPCPCGSGKKYKKCCGA